MKNLYDRIEYIIKNNRKKPNISLYEFAKSVGTNPSKFAEIKSGKVKTLSQNIALEISKIYDFSFKWILTGEGEMYEKQNPIKKELERTFDSYSEIEKTFKFPNQNNNIYNDEFFNQLKHIILLVDNWFLNNTKEISTTKKADIITKIFKMYLKGNFDISEENIKDICELVI